jgi:hypothetical protein
LASLNSAREKANISSAKTTANSILPIVTDCYLENKGIIAPLDTKTGGGPICSNGINAANWPSLQSSGYYYNAPTDSDISDGNFSFYVIKPSKPTIKISLSDSPSLSVINIPVPPCGFYGDVDYDGYVTDADKLLIQQAIGNIVAFTADQIIRGDVIYSPTMVLSALDALALQYYISGALETLPVCAGGQLIWH